MKYIIALLVGLTGTMVLGATTEAQASSITLHAPVAHRVGRSVVITGRVAGAVRTVGIQQRKSGHWVVMRKAAVSAGSYRTTLTSIASSSQIRVTAGGAFSKPVTVPASLTPDACGRVVMKSYWTAWRCTFDDEFNGTTLNRSAWLPQTNFAMGTQAAHACLIDDPSTVNVSGGSLHLSLQKVATPASCTFGGLSGPTNYVSGGVTSYRLFSQQYGNTATTFPGLHEAFWLWPDDRVASNTNSPFGGEIDVSETYSSYSNLSIPFLHYSADIYGNLVGTNTSWTCSAPRGVWHTYDVEWGPTKIQIFVDGTLCLTNTSGDPAFIKPYIMAFTQGMGPAGDAYDGRAPLGTMSVDYVRVWK
jgi:hypothetical protein